MNTIKSKTAPESVEGSSDINIGSDTRYSET